MSLTKMECVQDNIKMAEMADQKVPIVSKNAIYNTATEFKEADSSHNNAFLKSKEPVSNHSKPSTVSASNDSKTPPESKKPAFNDNITSIESNIGFSMCGNGSQVEAYVGKRLHSLNKVLETHTSKVKQRKFCNLLVR